MKFRIMAERIDPFAEENCEKKENKNDHPFTGSVAFESNANLKYE